MDFEKIVSNTEVIRTKRKTIAIQIAADGHLIVRSPLRLPQRDIITFLDKNRKWIEKHTEKALRINSKLAYLEPYSSSDIDHMAKSALSVIPDRVQYYADKLGITYGKITIRNQVTKWGSCTSKGNLNFNCLLMEAPPEVLDSVVVHELCHRIHMNHSKEFYEKVYSVYPEYDKWDKWLKENGQLLIRRMQAGMTK